MGACRERTGHEGNNADVGKLPELGPVPRILGVVIFKVEKLKVMLAVGFLTIFICSWNAVAARQDSTYGPGVFLTVTRQKRRLLVVALGHYG